MAKDKFAFSTFMLEGGQNMTDGEPVPHGIRFFFGLGQAAEAIKNWGFGTLLLIYYVQVLGVSGSLAGTAIAIALVFDAFTDPAVGSMSDNFRSKFGRRHPFMLAAIVPLPFFFFLLFWPPLSLSSFQLFVWLTVFTILTRTALTFFHVPYLALGAELSKDYHERTTIVMIRTGMGYLSALLVVAIAFTFFFVSSEAVPDPLLTRDPYFNFALMSSIAMCAMMLLSIVGTRGSIRHLSGNGEEKKPFRWSSIYADLFEALKNNSFRALIIGVFLLYIYLGVHGALATHLKTFFWHLDTNGIRAWQVCAILGGIIGVPFSPWFNRHLDKKHTVIWGVAIATIMGTGPVMAQLAHLMPTDPVILLPLLCLFAGVGSFAGIQALISAGSMIADIADEHELREGKRQEGIYFGSFSLAAKCTSGIGNLIAGIALDLIALSTYTDPDAVPQSVLTSFGWLYALVALISIFGLWVIRPYDLNKKRHDEIITELKATVWATKED